MAVRIYLANPIETGTQAWYDASNFAALTDFDSALTAAGANGFITVTLPAAGSLAQAGDTPAIEPGVVSEGQATAPVGAGSASMRINPRYILSVMQL